MRLCEAIELFKDHQNNNGKEKTQKSCCYLFRNLETPAGHFLISLPHPSATRREGSEGYLSPYCKT